MMYVCYKSFLLRKLCLVQCALYFWATINSLQDWSRFRFPFTSLMHVRLRNHVFRILVRQYHSGITFSVISFFLNILLFFNALEYFNCFSIFKFLEKMKFLYLWKFELLQIYHCLLIIFVFKYNCLCEEAVLAKYSFFHKKT